MKHIALLTVFTLITLGVFAQQTISFDDYVDEEKEFKDDDNQRVHTVLNSIDINRISGFGGFLTTYTLINDEFASMPGGGGGIIFNNLFIGGYGQGLSGNITIDNKNKINSFNHGGFWLGYEFFRKKMFHPVASARIGWGDVSGHLYNDNGSYNSSYSHSAFVITPGISAEVNLTRFFKANLGVEYRQTFLNSDYVGSSDLSGVGVFMTFVFGWF